VEMKKERRITYPEYTQKNRQRGRE